MSAATHSSPLLPPPTRAPAFPLVFAPTQTNTRTHTHTHTRASVQVQTSFARQLLHGARPPLISARRPIPQCCGLLMLRRACPQAVLFLLLSSFLASFRLPAVSTRKSATLAGTCGRVAMTPAPHAEGRQLDLLTIVCFCSAPAYVVPAAAVPACRVTCLFAPRPAPPFPPSQEIQETLGNESCPAAGTPWARQTTELPWLQAKTLQQHHHSSMLR